MRAQFACLAENGFWKESLSDVSNHINLRTVRNWQSGWEVCLCVSKGGRRRKVGVGGEFKQNICSETLDLQDCCSFLSVVLTYTMTKNFRGGLIWLTLPGCSLPWGGGGESRQGLQARTKEKQSLLAPSQDQA